MSWNPLPEAAVLKEGFNPSEQATLTAVAGAVDGLADIATAAINEARGMMESAGITLGAAGTIPDMLRPHVIALARWRWLIAFPQFKSLQTEERRKASEYAQDLLKDIAQGKLTVPDPDPATIVNPLTGRGSSELNIPMRTHVSAAATSSSSSSSSSSSTEGEGVRISIPVNYSFPVNFSFIAGGGITETVDNFSAFDPATGNFTVPATALYAIDLQLKWSGTTTLAMFLIDNATGLPLANKISSGQSILGAISEDRLNAVLSLTAGQIVSFAVTNTGGVPVLCLDGCYASIYKIT